MVNEYNYVKVAAAVPNVKVANTDFNVSEIKKLISEAAEMNVQILCFPELCITGYTCADLFQQKTLLAGAEEALNKLIEHSTNSEMIIIAGLPVQYLNRLYNTAVVFSNGKIIGAVPKQYLPNSNEFYEKRWFSSGIGIKDKEITICNQTVPFGTNLIFGNNNLRFGIEICEDLWLPQAPSNCLSVGGAQIIFNLSASNELIGKNSYRKQLISQQSAKCLAGYVYASAGFGESSTDLVFSGNAYIAENGAFLAETERFSLSPQIISADIDIDRLNCDRMHSTAFTAKYSSSDFCYINCSFSELPSEKISREIDAHPFVPQGNAITERCEEIFSIQVWGLATRLAHTGIKHAVIGISGGLDSTLALLVCARTFDKLNIPRENIVGITMPGFGTTGRTYNNSIEMMKALGVTIKEINIKDACMQHFKDIEHNINVLDVTYENTQARERTQILMDYANKIGALVIGTGDLSELVLGWATYNGDHMSMYAVNTSIPKTLVRSLVLYAANYQIDDSARKILIDVADTPISPELLPADKDGNIAQKTEDLVGPYELHDFFIYYTLRWGMDPKKIFFLAKRAFANVYNEDTIKKWMQTFYRRFFSQQFKRSCMPDGPKVGSVNLSPRGDLRMPSDASSALWLDIVNNL